MATDFNFSSKTREDYILACEATKGDQRAYEKLLSRYREMVYFTILKMITNKQDAEDLTIETFAKAFIHIDQYKPIYAFSTWLFKIATNNCIDYFRRKNTKSKSSEKQEMEDGMEEFVDKSNIGPEKELIKKQRKEFVLKILTELNPDHKKLIELRYYKEFSYNEIAEALNIPIGTVKAKLYRAKYIISNLMQDSSKHYF
ncbi:MAG TPA: sigma-70 family RNA polymerase sigma factor [Bacteroidales bacterium]|nr:sigma-70 family RNA polymerase sigma factor [Bacteroidales bacterium]